MSHLAQMGAWVLRGTPQKLIFVICRRGQCFDAARDEEKNWDTHERERPVKPMSVQAFRNICSQNLTRILLARVVVQNGRMDNEAVGGWQ